MPRLFVLLFLAGLALAIVAVIDCLSTDEYEIRALPKIVWVLIIILLLFPPIGPIAWFLCSDACRYLTGHTFMADGGAFMWA